MVPYIMPDHLIEEMNRVAEMYFESEEECGITEFVNKYANDEYREYFNAYKKQKEEDRKKGIIVN